MPQCLSRVSGHLGSPVLCSFGFIWPVFSFSFSALSLLLLAHHSLPAATALVALVLLIMFVCPLAFGHAQVSFGKTRRRCWTAVLRIVVLAVMTFYYSRYLSFVSHNPLLPLR